MQSPESANPDGAALSALDLTQARESLAQFTTTDALLHLEAAVRSLERLAQNLLAGQSVSLPEQREMERTLLRFRTDLRHAGVLAEQGLAFCKDWTDLLQPPATYGPSGGLCGNQPDSGSGTHELQVEA